MKKTNVSSR
jgi:hypothetical protein